MTSLFSHVKNDMDHSGSFSTVQVFEKYNAQFIAEYVTKVFKNPERRNVFSVHATGGGVSSLKWLFSVPGASNSLKHGSVPYSRASSMSILADKKNNLVDIDSYCSESFAAKLAEAAYRETVEQIITEEANILSSPEKLNVFGVGITASLATSVPKKSNHRCYIALYSQNECIFATVVLNKEILTRMTEDELCSLVAIDLIGQKSGLPPLLPQSHVEGIKGTDQNPPSNDTIRHLINIDELASYVHLQVRRESFALPDFLTATIQKNENTVIFAPKRDGETISTTPISSAQWIRVQNLKNYPSNTLIFPGSFNPLHQGHLKLVKVALEKIRKLEEQRKTLSSTTPLVLFEIAATNVDKPSLTMEQIEHRVNQFDRMVNPLINAIFDADVNYGICITSHPMFVSKSDVFQNAYFLIGTDTFVRLVDLKYYTPSSPGPIELIEAVKNSLAQGKLIHALANIESNNCKFIVGGRTDQVLAKQLVDDEKERTQVPFQTMNNIIESNTMAQVVCSIYPKMFHGLSEDEFREDISSSDIRKRSASK